MNLFGSGPGSKAMWRLYGMFGSCLGSTALAETRLG